MAVMNSVRRFLDDVIVVDATSVQHVQTIRTFLPRLHEHDFKVSTSKVIKGAMRVRFRAVPSPYLE